MNKISTLRAPAICSSCHPYLDVLSKGNLRKTPSGSDGTPPLVCSCYAKSRDTHWRCYACLNDTLPRNEGYPFHIRWLDVNYLFNHPLGARYASSLGVCIRHGSEASVLHVFVRLCRVPPNQRKSRHSARKWFMLILAILTSALFTTCTPRGCSKIKLGTILQSSKV